MMLRKIIARSKVLQVIFACGYCAMTELSWAAIDAHPAVVSPPANSEAPKAAIKGNAINPIASSAPVATNLLSSTSATVAAAPANLNNSNLDNSNLNNPVLNNPGLSNPVAAVPNSPTSPAYKIAPLDTPSALLKTFGGLALIVGLILLCAKVTKLLMGPMGHSQPLIKNIASLSLGAKEKIAVIEVGGKQILIGITPGRINTLLELPEANRVNPGEVQKSSLSAKNAAEFSKKLNEFLNAGNRHS